MSVTTVITLTSEETTAKLQELIQLDTSKPEEEVRALSGYLLGLLAGCRQATIDVQVAEGNAVAASGTVTFSGVGAANDTILVNGVTFTAVAASATGNQWNVGATAALSAANLAAAIAASGTALVNTTVTASALSNVCTVTAKKKGTMGNAVTIAEGVDGSSHMTVSGARLTNGANATAQLYTP